MDKRKLRKKFVANNLQSNSLSTILKQARKSGVLNLANQEFETIPASVWSLHDPPPEKERKAVDFSSGDNWWDQVELKKLYLNSNKLTSISDDIKKFSTLGILDLQDNALLELPRCIGEFEKLENLNVSYNQLSKLDFEFNSSNNILSLFLQHNKISFVAPKFFEYLEKCLKLNISYNLLETFSFSMQGLTNLRNLDLSHNKILTVPDEIKYLKNLSTLDLSNNSITSLPASLNELTKIEQLYVRNNRLISFPNMSSCKMLKELALGNNSLKSIPENLPESLSNLELRENKIISLNKECMDIKMLVRLDLASNDINKVDPEISLMPNLKVIALEGNPIKSIRRDIINRGSAAVLKFLQTRIIPKDNVDAKAEVQTSSLPQSLHSMNLTRNHEIIAARKLNIVNKDFDFVKNELDNFSETEFIDINISNCKLVEVPTLDPYKDSLKNLCLSGNKFVQIPPSFFNFSLLTHLNLSCNALTSLPNEIKDLKSLMEINIMSNRLTQIPVGLYLISSLENILADSNQITSIDVNGLKNLSKLSTLSLSNNNISQIPPELGNLEQIKALNINGNMFRIPRHAILSKGTLAIMEYLRSRIVVPS